MNGRRSYLSMIRNIRRPSEYDHPFKGRMYCHFAIIAAYDYASTLLLGPVVCRLWIRKPQAAYPQATRRTQGGFVCRHIHKMRVSLIVYGFR